MPNRWLQVKGDPSVRAFLFQQQRIDSVFDLNVDRLHFIVHSLLTEKGVFHIKLHYSSNQITCWFCDDAYRYRVFVQQEVMSPGFLNQFRDCKIDHLQPVISANDTLSILK